MQMSQIAAIVVAALCLSACGDKEVRDYASRLSAVLADYSQQLNARVSADTQLYRDLSAVYATEAERDIYESLRTARIERSYETSADLVEGRNSASQYMSWMRDTAQAEQQRAREYYAGEMAALNGSIAGLKRLQVDAAKVDALQRALDDLAQAPGLGTKIGDLKDSGEKFQNEFSLQACKSLQDRLANLAGSVTAIDNEKNTLGASIAKVQETEKNALPDELPALKDKEAALEARLKTLDAKEAALKKQLTDWQNALKASSHYDGKTCK